jgi:O-antigen ligase
MALNNYRLGLMGQGRIAGYSNNLAENPNDLALSLNLFLPLAAVLAVTAKRRLPRLLAWGFIALSIGAVVVTFSRGGFLTLAIEGALFTLLLARKRGVRVILVAMVLAAIALTFLPAGYSERLSTIVNIESDTTGSAQMRYGDTMVAIEFMVTHPLIGAGLGQGLLAMNELRGNLWTVVHNAYLNYGVDMAFPGFVLFVWLVLVTYRTARRIEKLPAGTVPSELLWMASGVRISLAGFIIAAFFHPVGYDFYFFYLAGLAVALKTTAARQFGVQAAA